MFVSYPELKKILYIGQTVLGFLFLSLAWYQFQFSFNNPDSALNFITALILVTAGFLCVLFGLDAYLLRDEPDVWK